MIAHSRVRASLLTSDITSCVHTYKTKVTASDLKWILGLTLSYLLGCYGNRTLGPFDIEILVCISYLCKENDSFQLIWYGEIKVENEE